MAEIEKKVRSKSSVFSAKKETIIVPETVVEDFEIPMEYSPISGAVIERSYNEATVVSEIGDIPEPDFGNGVPTFEDFQDEVVEKEVVKEPSPFDNISNSGMTDLDNKDAKFASAHLVDTVLDGYKMLHQLGSKASKISEDTITKLVMSGEIDLDLRIAVSESDDVNAQEYVDMHNSQADELFEYDESFNDKVRPTMIRVFQKKGWGITDEQFLLASFGKDIATKLVMAYSFKKTANLMLENFANFTKANKGSVEPNQVFTPDTIQQNSRDEDNEPVIKVATAKRSVSIEDIEADMMEE